ncbi:MAG: 2Fe-2S iron-sulfur cluster-binding protein, partial [Pseudanabaena sp.]
MSVVTLKINDIEVAAEQGKSILATAKEAGIAIPTLCHLEGVSDVGACRLCMVEVKGSNKLLAACVTQVAEGMEVHTHT